MDRIDEIFGQLRRTPGAKLYTLIDGAQYLDFDGTWSKSIVQSGGELHRLIDVSRPRDHRYPGPVLVAHGQEWDSVWLRQFSSKLNMLSFASFLSSSADTGALVKHLADLTNVSHDDGSQWAMRYFDPRVLPHWITCLTDDQRSFALSGIDQWIFEGVGGALVALEGDSRSIRSCGNVISLTAKQADDLVTSCLPYAIMNEIKIDAPDLLASIPEADRYQILRSAINAAANLEIHEFGELKVYCVLVLCGGEIPQTKAGFDELLGAWR